ncbi:MAG TPA: hypothetical protein VK981_12145 [Ramlibacter sp.]|nr:hypothetical protein [Ramlibacter sp.]
MKIPALVAALALAGGAAFAQTAATADADNRNQAAMPADAPKGDGIMDKTKRAFHNMGDKMRATGKKIAKKVDQADHRDNKTEHAARSDTRTMGAPGAETPESARRTRMDEAYANSKKARPQQH